MSPLDAHELTLQAYEHGVDAYVQSMPTRVSPEVATWLERAVQGLSLDAAILEVGTGSGLDAAHLESSGFTVQRSDGAAAFVEYLRAQGYQARQLNIITDELGGQYNLIVANHVLLHVLPEVMPMVLRKFRQALSTDGRVAIGLKYGEGGFWSEAKLHAPRYTHLWTEITFKNMLVQAGFVDVQSSRVVLVDGVERLHVVAYGAAAPR